MLTTKQTLLVFAGLLSVGCADRQKQQQQQPVVENRQQNTSQEGDETLDPGSEDIYGGTGGQDVFPLDNGTTANVSTTVDPSTQGLQNSSTLAAGSINPGNNAASGGGVNQAALMQGMMGMMTSMMSGQQPNPAALMGMFGSALPGGAATGGLVTQLTPLLTQAVSQ